MHQNHLEGLLKQTAGQKACSWHKICILNKITDDTDAAGPKAALGEPWSYREQLKNVSNFGVLGEQKKGQSEGRVVKYLSSFPNHLR